MNWRDWWNTPHSIFVNARHLQIHYAHVADVIVRALPAQRPLVVVDYGCGEALDAGRVADAAGRLILYDTAERVRTALATRYRGVPNITVADDAELAATAPDSVDAVVVYSVIQYMAREEFTALLAQWRAWLRPDGLLLLVDVIPPEAGLFDDVAALIATAWRYGFVRAAIGGLASTLFSPYRPLRRGLGLTVYTEAEIRTLLEDAGFAAHRHPSNLHFNRARMTIFGRRRP